MFTNSQTPLSSVQAHIPIHDEPPNPLTVAVIGSSHELQSVGHGSAITLFPYVMPRSLLPVVKIDHAQVLELLLLDDELIGHVNGR